MEIAAVEAAVAVVCVCVFAYAPACMCVFAYAPAYMCMHACVHVCVSECVCVCVRVCVCVQLAQHGDNFALTQLRWARHTHPLPCFRPPGMCLCGVWPFSHLCSQRTLLVCACITLTPNLSTSAPPVRPLLCFQPPEPYSKRWLCVIRLLCAYR